MKCGAEQHYMRVTVLLVRFKNRSSFRAAQHAAPCKRVSGGKHMEGTWRQQYTHHPDQQQCRWQDHLCERVCVCVRESHAHPKQGGGSQNACEWSLCMLSGFFQLKHHQLPSSHPAAAEYSGEAAVWAQKCLSTRRNQGDQTAAGHSRPLKE
jgi:hypothetical protein